MAFQLFVNLVDYTNTLLSGDCSISEALQANGSSMDGTLFMLDSGLPDPEGGNLIEFYRDLVIEFRGRITEIDISQPGSPLGLMWKINCVDQTWDMDTKMIQGKFAATTLGELFRTIIGIVGKSFTANNVAAGPAIPEQEIDLEPASSVLSKAAEAVEYQWYVDYNRDVHLFFVTDFASPIVGQVIDLDTDVVSYFDIEVSENIEQVKNVLFLKGGKAKSTTPYTENFTADGSTRFFPLGYQPWEATQQAVSLRVGTGWDAAGNPQYLGGPMSGATPYTVKVDGIDGTAGDGSTAATTVFVCVDNQGCRLPDGIAAPGTPAAKIPIQIAYDNAYDAVVQVEDPDSIEEMRAREDTPTAPSDGRHEFVFQIPEIRVESEEAIINYGNLLLSRYAQPIVSVTFKSWVQGWAAGQSLTLKSARYNLIGTGGRRFYVHSVKKRILIANDNVVHGTMLAYEIEASSSPFPT